MNKYSLNNKWYIPREEHLERESALTFKVLKHALIYMKDHFQQLPGGKIDLNTITMKFNNAESTRFDMVNDLDNVAIFFDERVDEDSGEKIMFFDVKDFKDVPNGASSVTTQYLGLHSGILVKTFDSLVRLKENCRQLCEAMGDELHKEWCEEDDCVYSIYEDGYILESRSCKTYNDEYFIAGKAPDTVHWSEYNDTYVDEESDYVFYGYVNGNDEEWFYSYDSIVDDENYRYADSEVAADHGVYWSDSIQIYAKNIIWDRL